MYSIPTNELKELVQDGSDEEPDTRLPKPRAFSDVASSSASSGDSGKLMSCRLSFPDLIIEKAKEKSFLKELSDQLRVAISGLGSDPLPATIVPRLSDQDSVCVQLSIPQYRGEQLKALLVVPAMLSYTPLLRFARFDANFWAVSSGTPVEGLNFPAPQVLARLDEMEKRYLDIKERKNIVESFHDVMKRTNPYEQRMHALQLVENPRVPFPGEDVPEQPPPVPTFPWSGVGNVLSPRAASPPGDDGSYMHIIDSDASPVVRVGPPSATVVVAKSAIDSALQQLSVDGVQLHAASSEINRRIEEAAEHSELTRIAAMGLASPQVLEALVRQSTMKREQQRQKDELAVMKAWERDGLASVERENSWLYMQRLFAIATGDDEAVALLDSGDRKILAPEKFREEIQKMKTRVITEMVPKMGNVGRQKLGLTVHVVRGSNLPENAECFVRIRVGSSENQTSVSTNGSWAEQLFIEFAREARPNGVLELLVFQYNSLGRDTLLASAALPLNGVKDTDSQVGVWVLSPGKVSLSLRFDLEGDETTFKRELQPTQNLMRERNMDFIADQVELVEEERRRLENKLDAMDARDARSMASALVDPSGGGGKSIFPPSLQLVGDTWGAADVGNGAMPASLSAGLLHEVEKPLPTYAQVYAELLAVVKAGKLPSADGQQLAYDFSFLGQSKLDFGTDPKILEYLSLQSDVVAQFQAEPAIVTAGVSALSNMLTSTQNEGRKRQISLVVWEAATRCLALAQADALLAEQVLSALALAVAPPRTSDDHVDFALFMWTQAKEPIQLEQILQLLTLCKSNHRREDQLSVVMTVLERFRFNVVTVQRALTLIPLLYAAPLSGQGIQVGKGGGVEYPSNGSDIELVVVAAGLYADSAALQVVAIDALASMAGVSPGHAERIETITGPVIIEQSLERNVNDASVQVAVARLLLRIADLRPREFDLPEALPALFRIVSTSPATDVALMGLAAIRACHASGKRDALFSIPDAVGAQFTTSVEKKSIEDATIAREACLAIESMLSSADLREVLVRAGVTAIPLKAVQAHAAEHPKMVRQFLSCLHAAVAASTRAAFQFARMDGVQVLMNLALFPTAASEWRCFAILAEACAVEEAKQQFAVNEDIERIVDLINRLGKTGTGDTETVLQGIRVVAEIAFNSSFSTKDLFRKLNDVVKVWFGGSGQVSFNLQVMVWAILNKRIPQKSQNRLERLTSPNGRELSVPLTDAIVKDFNLWVTSQGGADAGASVANRKEFEEKPSANNGKGFVATITDFLAGDDGAGKRRK